MNHKAIATAAYNNINTWELKEGTMFVLKFTHLSVEKKEKVDLS